MIVFPINKAVRSILLGIRGSIKKVMCSKNMYDGRKSIDVLIYVL